jgi:hypothetical protein
MGRREKMLTRPNIKAALGLALLAGCWAGEPTQQPADGTKARQPGYRLIDIERAYLRHRIRGGQDGAYGDAAYRFFLAGPVVVAELAEVLESGDRSEQSLAGVALDHLTGIHKWPEASAYVAYRIRCLPPSGEAAQLLRAMDYAMDAVRLRRAMGQTNDREKPPWDRSLAGFVARYVWDEAFFVEVRLSSSQRSIVQHVKVCHLAARVLQGLTGENFGIEGGDTPWAAVEAARRWAQENPASVRIPDTTAKSPAKVGAHAPAPPSYRLVDIERAYLRDRRNGLRDPEYPDAAFRFGQAGPSVLAELPQILESQDPSELELAFTVLSYLIDQKKWPETWAFVAERLERLPPSLEAGTLLRAINHPDVGSRKELMPYVCKYLSDETYLYHAERTVSEREPSRQEMGKVDIGEVVLEYPLKRPRFSYRPISQDIRVCDIAAQVLRRLCGEDFGIVADLCPAAAVERARRWAREHPELARLPDR